MISKDRVVVSVVWLLHHLRPSASGHQVTVCVTRCDSCSVSQLLFSFLLFFLLRLPPSSLRNSPANTPSLPWLTNTAVVHKLVIPQRERHVWPYFSLFLPIFFPLSSLFFSRVVFSAIFITCGPSSFQQLLPLFSVTEQVMLLTLALYFSHVLASLFWVWTNLQRQLRYENFLFFSFFTVVLWLSHANTPQI